MTSIGFATKHGGEQPHHRRPADRATLVIPSAVAGDAHPGMAAEWRVPLIDRRRTAASFDRCDQLGDALAYGFNGAVRFGHWPGL